MQSYERYTVYHEPLLQVILARYVTSENVKIISSSNSPRVTRSRGPYLIALFESYAHIPSTVLK